MTGPDTDTNAPPYPIWGFGPPSPEPDTKKLDALLASLNGSAERFQTLWFSFLGLTLYLAIAALATTHRNLLLGEPQTLPILNIKVELLPFYVIAPLLYPVFHFYLLMMLALLARTAAEFDKQLRTTLPGTLEQERYRAQVGNALFLQLLVGMKGERTGINALLMGVIALITIVLAPLATLVLMQMMFLPYHHLRITWWHRAVVVADLVLIVVMTYRCFFPRGFRKAPLVLGALGHKPRWVTAMAFCVLLAVVLVPLVDGASFQQGRWAGEPRPASFKEWTQWMAGERPSFRETNPDYSTTEKGVVFGFFPDRLKLASETIVGKEKWERAKEEIASRKGAKEIPGEGDFVPTIKLDDRDLRAADLSGADLRGVSLNGAQIQGANLQAARLDGTRLSCEEHGNSEVCAQLRSANLSEAQLPGANLDHAQLQGAHVGGAQLQRANFFDAQMQDADLGSAQLQGAVLIGAQLQGANLRLASLLGADLENTELQGADLETAELRGANLGRANLRGTDLRGAFLEGADFDSAELQGADLLDALLRGTNLGRAQLQGANLARAELQGTDLSGAQLQGAELAGAQMQGADLRRADLADSDLGDAFVFRTDIAHASLSTASIQFVHADQVKLGEVEPLSDADVNAWIADATQFAAEKDKEAIRKRFARLKLNPGFQTPAQDAADEANWSEVTKQSLASDPDGTRHRQRLAAFLATLGCRPDGAPDVARGLIRQERLAVLGDQLELLRARMKEGRKSPEKCPGVAGFTDDDWRALDAIKPD